MKKILFIVSAVFLLCSSCNKADQETINKMADEMCAAMMLYEEDNPLSIIEVANSLKAIAKNADEYSKITESQLEDAMKTICPTGFEKYIAIMTAE